MQQCRGELLWLGCDAEDRPPWRAVRGEVTLSSGVGLFLRSSKWGGAVLQCMVSALELQQFCVKPFVGHANLIRCRYWRLEERRDGAVSRVVCHLFVQFILCLL